MPCVVAAANVVNACVKRKKNAHARTNETKNIYKFANVKTCNMQ